MANQRKSVTQKTVNRKGVEIRRGRVRISFTWQGKRVYETTEFKPTATGLEYAAKLRKTVIAAIQHDRFDYAETFPNSNRVVVTAAPTFYQYAAKYIDIVKDDISKSTLRGYRKIVNSYWLPQFGDTEISEISTGQIRDAIIASGLSELSGKTFNNAMTPLRAIFELAIDYEDIEANPCTKIKSKKRQTPLPDPLTTNEVELVLKTVRQDWLTYFQVAFGTGMRPSELIELRWGDIDLVNGTIKVERGYVEQETKDTKTHKARILEINALTRRALMANKSKKAVGSDLVFLLNGKQINDDKPPRLIWDAALKQAGIRHRKAYCTRHTFASTALSAGKNPYMVSEQMGNSVQMLLVHYAKWVKQADTGMSDLFASTAAQFGSKQL